MMESVFVRLTEEDDKRSGLVEALSALQQGLTPRPAVCLVNPASFRQIPGSPFAYWVSDRIRQLFKNFPPLESGGRVARRTNGTTDDKRWIRAWWEVSPLNVGRQLGWVPHAKGGAYSTFYFDVHLLIAWDDRSQTYPGYQGTEHRPDLRPASLDYFFRPGITWPRRTQRGLNLRALPEGTIFGDKGPTIFAEPRWLLPLLAITNSIAFRGLVSLQMAFGSYEAGVIQRTPIPNLTDDQARRLGQLSQVMVSLKMSLDTTVETSHAFHKPSLLQVPGVHLMDKSHSWQENLLDIEGKLSECQNKINDMSYDLYCIDIEDRRALEQHHEKLELIATDEEQDVEDEASESSLAIDQRTLVSDLTSYAVGCILGRWDVRFADENHQITDLPDPFDSLPTCSPGMLRVATGAPAVESPTTYPLRIDWDGILVDDTDHADDIIRRVCNVLEVIWKDQADGIEKEVCEALGVADLRDYFRKPGVGGFWDDHIKRYSKSRRKAPIYWLLQSSKKNYAIWIYYHRLDKDIFFKALLNYVEPKVRKEDARLDELRSQKSSLGLDAKGSKKFDKEIDRQEAFLSELRDFEDKLRRAANLHLVPDLNDGVVLNIAPLRELVPWKDARSYWDDLMDGKYEWSSIGKQLREKGMVT